MNLKNIFGIFSVYQRISGHKPQHVIIITEVGSEVFLYCRSFCLLFFISSLFSAAILISTDVYLRVSERRWKIRSSWSTTCWIRWTRWSSAAAWPSPSSKSWTTWRWGRHEWNQQKPRTVVWKYTSDFFRGALLWNVLNCEATPICVYIVTVVKWWRVIAQHVKNVKSLKVFQNSHFLLNENLRR